MDHSQLVTIKEFYSPTQANLYLALLRDAGIEAVLAGEYADEVLPLGTFSQIRLMVRGADEKQAHRILSADFDEGEFKRETTKKYKVNML